MIPIIHLTDLHFGAGHHNRISFHDAQQHLTAFINSLPGPPVVVVSGDITYQARDDGYNAASAFFEAIIAETNVERHRFIFCPGNHDVQKGSPFKGFTAFAYGIRRDNVFDFTDKTSISCVVDDLYFIVTNSSYHANTAYGLAHASDLKKELEHDNIKLHSHRFAVIHHNLLPIGDWDTSVTRNSYEYLAILDAKQISAIFHGHQHFNVAFPVGHSQMTINGAGSFGYAENGLVNGFNVYFIEATGIAMERFALLIDQPVTRTTGFARVGDRQVIR